MVRYVCAITCAGRTFAIARYSNGYVGIEKKFIKDGRISETIPFDRMFWHKDMWGTISAILRQCIFTRGCMEGMSPELAAFKAIRTVEHE